MVEVSAGLFFKKIDGKDKFLICQRPKNKSRALCWEFVGGKREIGESGEDALKRECIEELDVLIKVESEFCKVEYVYPDITIRMTVYNAKIVSGAPKLLEHNDLKWIEVKDIDKYTFCPADKDVLEKIKAEKNG